MPDRQNIHIRVRTSRERERLSLVQRGGEKKKPSHALLSVRAKGEEEESEKSSQSSYIVYARTYSYVLYVCAHVNLHKEVSSI